MGGLDYFARHIYLEAPPPPNHPPRRAVSAPRAPNAAGYATAAYPYASSPRSDRSARALAGANTSQSLLK
jgi:hypothetical protein